MPGFQPARRNPSARRSEARPSENNEHGMDVLYQVRSFADIKQQTIVLPPGEAGTAMPMGMMATLRITRPFDDAAVDTP